MATSPQNHSASRNHAGADSVSPSSPRRASGEENIKDKAGTLAGEAKSEAQAKVDKMRDTAADKVDTLAESAKAAASELKGDDIGHLSDYVSDLAQSLGQLSSNMREKTGDDLLHEVSRLARDNPALFVTGSIAIGFGLSRFAKASAPTQTTATTTQQTAGTVRQNPSRGAGSADTATTHATGFSSATPYGVSTPTQTNVASGNATGRAAQQQPGVRS